jgi:hypothetical protein
MRSIASATVFVTAAVLMLGAGVAAAQVTVVDPLSTIRVASASRVATAPGPIASAVSHEAGWWNPPARTRTGGPRGALIGAAIGAGTAAAVTYWAAAKYGENEGGRFCTGCFMNWGAVTIPAAALVGALVGHALGGSSAAPQHAPRAHRTFITPAISRRGGALTVAVRY